MKFKIKEIVDISYQNIGIVGLGMIGASIALSLRAKNKSYNIIGVDTEEETLKIAFERGIIQLGNADLRILRGCEVVFVATPIETTNDTIKKVYDLLGDSAIISDVASVKRFIEQELPDGIRYVGGHPMAGTEKGGILAAKAHLFENAYYVLTRSSATTDADYSRVSALIGDMNAIPIDMTAAAHDEMAADISHLPHMTAYALVHSALKSEESFKTAAGGFRDITRIADSDPKFWAKVALLNRGEVLRGIKNFSDELNMLEKLIEDKNEGSLIEFFKAARDLRQKTKCGQAVFSLTVDIRDTPNALGKITSLLGKKKVNIDSVAILNSREGEGGVLTLGFLDKVNFENAAALLKKNKYECS